MTEEKQERNFRIRLEARLKNDYLAHAREKLGFTQKAIAAALEIYPGRYSTIENMHSYPDEDLQQRIMDFYKDHGINLDSEKIFPKELKKAKFNKKYVVTQEIPPERLLPLSNLDKKLLMPVEIEDSKIREEDLRKTIKGVLNSLTDRQSNIIKMSFGLPPYEKKYSDEEIGGMYNLTGSRIQQIRQKAIRRLRHSSRRDELRSFLGDDRIN